MTPPQPIRALERPPRLNPGDRVAVVAPAGPVPPKQLATGRAVLESWGLEVDVAPHVLDRHKRLGYLAGADADRAADLQNAWLDPDISAVLCARGGYGAHRMVDLLDWEAMRAVPPKVFAGYSDITALHEAMALRLGASTLHAPMVASGFFDEDGASARGLRDALFTPERATVLGGPQAQALVPGPPVHGVTMGGCLAVLADSVGTPTGYPSAQGAILLLEDVGEECYRLDRILTRLLRSGWFEGVAGIALGSWHECLPDPAAVRELMLDRLGGLGVPIVWELGFGHASRALTVPLGADAVLDAKAGQLRLAEPPLR